MTKLTEYTSYADAQKHWSPDKLWELFDGNRDQLNIAHECIDRHVDGGRPAVILAHADGGDETLSFADIARESSRFAHFLAAQGVGEGRPGRRDARAVAAVLHRDLRRHQARRHRGSAVHAVRPGRHPLARAGLRTEDSGHERRKGADGRRHSRHQGRGGERAIHEGARKPTGLFRGDYAQRRLRDLPVHVGHDARIARGGQAHASLHRHADAGGPVRHRPAARRPFLLPVVARVGPRPVARHARASLRSASPSARSPASSAQSGCSRRCTITSSPIFRRRRRITG